MPLSDFELHPDRLATTDANGRRIFLYPADVRGFFRRRRTLVQNVLIVFFLVLPWIKIAGRQALCLDIGQRRFEIFGLSLRAHHAPLLIFVFGAAAFGLFFATAVFGRVWCGWACPQTVFIDGVFRRIERWIEGGATERRKLAQAPWSFMKARKYAAKWVLYVLVTLVITHSFMAYFVGTDRLREMMMQSPTENWGSFLFMFFVSAVILFDFAWFREQFCTIVCPYGRFQSVLMDSGSMVVAYDQKRGEPRATPQAKMLAKAHNSALGDCVNCYRCVQVCPTGIDIRRGLQMECIACTACVDACDDVMTKLKKPTGLIRYDSALKRERPAKRRRLSARAGLYLALSLGSVISLVICLATLSPIDVEVLRAKGSPYLVQTLEDGSTIVINHFVLELSNQSGARRDLRLALDAHAEAGGAKLIMAPQPVVVEDGQVTRVDIFVRAPKAFVSGGQAKIGLSVDAQANRIQKEVTLVGPFS